MTKPLTRRQALFALPAAAGAAALVAPAVAQAPKDPFRYCLNTSTISGQKLDLVEVVEIAAKAGYQAIEPWIREMEAYAKGGSLRELGKRIKDRGLTVESSIGFAEWIVDDDEKRKKGVEQMKRDMDLAGQLGSLRIAAPPVGATKQTDLSLLKAAERYRAILEIGDQTGVVPQVEVWGPSATLGKLAEAAFIAIESRHPKACILPDVYHLHKGGSGHGGLKLLSNQAVFCIHFNDYPAEPQRSDITDAHRVYPGDGVAPLKQLLRDLKEINYQGVLSLELFNREYWKLDALTVAKTGLEKMKAAVAASLG